MFQYILIDFNVNLTNTYQKTYKSRRLIHKPLTTPHCTHRLFFLLCESVAAYPTTVEDESALLQSCNACVILGYES